MPGRTGRRRLPTRLKLLKGETRPSRLNANEPELEGGVPPRPTHLKGDAAKEWTRLAKLTTGMRVLTVADGPILEATCMAYAELREAQRLIDKQGAVYQTLGPDGSVLMTRKNPAADLRSDAWKRWVSGLGHFGLSPATRSKVSAQPPERPSTLARFRDPMEEWQRSANRRRGA